MAATDELLTRLVASLNEDPAYERHGEVETSPLGLRAVDDVHRRGKVDRTSYGSLSSLTGLD